MITTATHNIDNNNNNDEYRENNDDNNNIPKFQTIQCRLVVVMPA